MVRAMRIPSVINLSYVLLILFLFLILQLYLPHHLTQLEAI